jgi:hypothetical protein
MNAVPVARDAGARRCPAACAKALVSAVVLVLAVAGVAAGALGDDEPAVAGADSAAAAVAVPAVPAVAAPTAVKAPVGEAEIPTVDLWDTGINATGAVLMTPLFPGWGQLYSDGGWRAGLAFGVEMYFWSNLLTRDRQARRDLDYASTLAEADGNWRLAEAMAVEHRAQMTDFVWWSGGAMLIIALDAYVGAHLFNFDQDPVPVPDRWDDVFGPVGSGPAVTAGAGPEVTVFQWRKGF